MTSGASLAIRQLSLDCRLPAPLASGGDPGRRLERIARTELPRALAEALAPLDRAGEGLVFVRRLEVDLDLDLDLSPRNLAERWASALRDGLLARLSSASDAAERVTFASRAHYLAAFLRDHTKGLAWQCWYYRGLDGLRPLPRSAALRTALLDDAQTGRDALRALAEPDLVPILQALDAADARRVLEGLQEPGGTGVSLRRAAVRLADHWDSLVGHLAAAEPGRAALLLWSRLLRLAPPIATRETASLCLAACRLAGVMAGADEVRTRRLLVLFREPDSAQGLTALEPQLAPALAPLLELGSASRRELIRRLLAPPRQSPGADPSEPRQSAFGNLFLLLPLLPELPLGDMTRGWRGIGDVPPTALLTWALCAACQPPSQRGACLGDPLVRALCAVGDGPGAHDLNAWLAALGPDALRQAHCGLVEAVAPAPAALECAVPPIPGAGPLVREKTRGLWLTLGSGPCELTRDEVIARSNQVAPWSTLARDHPWLLPQPVQRGWSLPALLAQHLLRRLAYRLPGFSESSLAHLHTNFLCMPAWLTPAPECLQVRLGPVPLGLVLRLTGATRQRYELPGFSPLPIQLSMEG